MRNAQKTLSHIIVLLIFAFGLYTACANAQGQISEFNSVRANMGDLGNDMPQIIKGSRGNDARILERVFEINTYTFGEGGGDIGKSHEHHEPHAVLQHFRNGQSDRFFDFWREGEVDLVFVAILFCQ